MGVLYFVFLLGGLDLVGKNNFGFLLVLEIESDLIVVKLLKFDDYRDKGLYVSSFLIHKGID